MTGYNEDFLDGIRIPLPTYAMGLQGQILRDKPDLRNGMVADYLNYSLVMNKRSEIRAPVLVALNINQNLLRSVARKDDWRIDDRIGFDFQLDNDYYANNPWDRGHMARRASAAWAETIQGAKRASNETFYYSNSCLQHANLNRDEWVGLEDWVLTLGEDADGRITSFSGPIYGDHDRSIEPSGRPLALVPAGFFKIVCFKNKTSGDLDVRAFVMYQDEKALKDRKGRSRYNNQTYQVTVGEVEDLTGIQFDDKIYDANPLYSSTSGTTNPDGFSTDTLRTLNIPDRNLPERHEISAPAEMVGSGVKRQTLNDDIVDIYIAAAMVNPKGADKAGEWISVINMGAEEVDLDGWTIADNAASLDLNTVLDAAERKIRPGESRVIRPVTPLALANDGDVIKLFAKDGARIDWVNYTKRMVKEGQPVLFLSPRDTLE